jgi:hypothetical protein
VPTLPFPLCEAALRRAVEVVRIETSLKYPPEKETFFVSPDLVEKGNRQSC